MQASDTFTLDTERALASRTRVRKRVPTRLVTFYSSLVTASVVGMALAAELVGKVG